MDKKNRKKIIMDMISLIAALGLNKSEKKIFKECLKGNIELIISPELIAFLFVAMDCPGFKFTTEEKLPFLLILKDFSNPEYDPSEDNLPYNQLVLECALKGKANFIITQEEELLEIKNYKGIEIMKGDNFYKKHIN